MKEFPFKYGESAEKGEAIYWDKNNLTATTRNQNSKYLGKAVADTKASAQKIKIELSEDMKEELAQKIKEEAKKEK